MTTFILLHGSFHAAWNWHRILPLLEAAGHRAVPLDLPGHGLDSTPPSQVTLALNVQRVLKEIDCCEGRVVLVAHSRNGIVISQAAEERPGRIAGLVYLAAYMVPNGRSMMDYAITDSGSLVLQNLRAPLPRPLLVRLVRWLRAPVLRWLAQKLLPRALHVHALDRSAYRDALYHDCGDDIVELANALLEPEPNWSGFTPLRLTDGAYGRVPRTYVECLDDRAVTLELQRRMVRDSPGARVVSLQSGHSPFFSQPERLTEVLLGCG